MQANQGPIIHVIENKKKEFRKNYLKGNNNLFKLDHIICILSQDWESRDTKLYYNYILLMVL